VAILVARESENSMIEKTDEKTSRELLSQNRVGRLGCVLASGGPYVVPVNYLFADGYVYVHSMPGLKISTMEINRRVCLQTDRVSSDGFSWKSAIAFGEFEVVSEKAEIDRVLNLFFREFPGFTPVEARLDAAEENRRSIVFRINVSNLTGVRETS